MTTDRMARCLLCPYGDGYPDMLVGELGFSWQVEGVDGMQSAYRLTVARAKDGDIVWDTDWVESPRSAGVEYGGPQLKSDADYIARVYVRDSEGGEYASAPVNFATGLMDDSLWKARWLASPHTEAGSAPVFRKTFELAGAISRARLLICGLGYYELWLNGRQVGDRYMDPAWTDFNRRVCYVAHDVAQYLRQGTNAIGVCLGAGWFTNEAGMPHPVFIAQLMLEYEDGRRETIASLPDGTWLALKNVWVLANTLYTGEIVDGRLELPGWSEPDFLLDREQWTPALEAEPPKGKLTPMRVEPIRCVRRMPAASVSEPQAGVYVVDFAQNLAGIIRLELHGQRRGSEVKIRYAEILDDAGMLSTENLRTAQACDRYICRGGEEFYQARFTYHGFRYAEVTGLEGPLNPRDITALVMRSDVRPRSTFETSSALVNDIQRICVWTEGNNLHSVPTDCPQRDERLGWLNDLTVRLEESMFNFDMDVFLRKYLQDIMDAQGATGAIADTAPYVRYGSQPADPVCASYLILPWLVYSHYGDEAVLRKAWPGIQAWTEYLLRQRQDGIVNYSYYGDWAAPIGGNQRFSIGNGAVSAITPGRLMSTGFLYMDCRILADIAQKLGMTAERDRYLQLAAETAESLNRTYLNEREGYYAQNSQAANTFMLYLNIVPEECRLRVLENLCADVLAHDTHLTTGNLCTRYILDVLADNGRIDLAYALVTQTTYPSWGYMLSRGATTTWERWEYVDSGELVGMASHDHPMYSTVSGWFYKYLAGFRPDSTGFASFELRPFFPKKLDRVHATVHTVKGTAEIEWRRCGAEIHVDVRVPFNSCCRLMATDEMQCMKADGEALSGCAAVRLGPGAHSLVLQRAQVG